MNEKSFIAAAIVGCFLGGSAIGESAATTSTAIATQADPSGSSTGLGAGASAAAPVASSEELGEIIITAQRRTENLQNAAVAVDVVSGEALAKAGITSPYQLGSMVPSLVVEPGGGANTEYFLRGVGNFTNNAYSDPAIAFNYDGVYVGRPSSTSGVFYDLDRMEVLKGPQGTLYGRNATAGAINVLPMQPKIGETSGFFDAAYGNYGAINLQGAVNLPVGSESALRFSGTWNKHDGYLSDGTSDDNTVGFRAQFLTHPTDVLSIRVAADYSHTGGEGTGASYQQVIGVNPANGQYVYTPAGFDPSIGVLDPRAQAFRSGFFSFQAGRTLGPVDSDVEQDNRFFGVHSEIAYTLDVGTLTIIPAYRQANLDYKSDVFSGTAWIREKDEQYSLEARFAGNRIGMFDYILGAHYFDEPVNGDYTILQDALTVFQDFDIKTKSAAAFGRVTANITDQFRLVGGARFTHDDKKFDGQAAVIIADCVVTNAFGLPNCPTTPVLPLTDTAAQLPFPLPAPNGRPLPIGTTGAIAINALTVVDKELTTSKGTYRAAAEYDVGPRSLLYASYETGFRSGGFSVSYGKETYQPEYITAYTLGSKNRLFDNRLQLNAEAFLWQYRDQQVNHRGVDGHGVTGQFTENVGRSINKGVEVESQFLATRTTLLSATGQYLATKYTNFVYEYPAVGAAPPTVGCPVTKSTTNPLALDVNCSGKPAYNAPKVTLNLGVQQTVPINDYKLVLAADTQYRSSRYVGFEYLPFQLAPSVWQSNATVSFSPSTDRWTVALYGRNIEDKRTPTNSIIFLGLLATEISSPPRTYGVTLSERF
ncbi:MAG: TonB-dependent receptor [Pseudomonadota bacterium]|nr:TonB-dependent receptor [Pseudomonadota bacterium]